MAATRKTSWFADFSNTFRQSIYSPPFYAVAVQQKTGQALGFFMKLAVVLTLISLVGAGSFWLGMVQFERNLPDLVTKLSNNFPVELTITIKGGQASTNVTEPYFIPNDDINTQDSKLKHWVVIDTKTPYSSEQFKQYSSFAWLTKDTLFYYGNYSESSDSSGNTSSSLGEIRAMPLSDVSDMTIDRAKVHGWLAMFEPWVRVLTPVFALFVVGLVYVAVLFNLVYLFILACLVWVVGKCFKKNFNYGASYRVGLYAASLPFLLSGLANACRVHVPPFSVTILALIIVVANLQGWKSTELGFIQLGARRRGPVQRTVRRKA
jgi:hypothetical protein